MQAVLFLLMEEKLQENIVDILIIMLKTLIAKKNILRVLEKHIYRMKKCLKNTDWRYILKIQRIKRHKYDLYMMFGDLSNRRKLPFR